MLRARTIHISTKHFPFTHSVQHKTNQQFHYDTIAFVCNISHTYNSLFHIYIIFKYFECSKNAIVNTTETRAMFNKH